MAQLKRVLVANRGEIAARIIRGCHALGIEAVAGYSDADRDAPYIADADATVRLGPAEPQRSYLDPDAVVRAATASGCDAVHPGYGFLSERPVLAEACAAAGLVFVGPSPDALRRLGDKVAARALAERSGLGLVPGGSDPAAIPLPLLVKAAAGGGGRGMRVVRDRSEVAEAMAAAAREAQAAFGDPTLYVERYLEGARHVEVQALGDGQGGAVHLGLRDCSLQRRHQKVLEEAPAPGIDEAEAARLGEAACALLREVGYAGAATVELLRAADGATYFLEANARLQVEHPVTELVTDTDLVAWQLRIAGGERLPATLDWRPQGHAVEARLVAEDPDHGFLPTAGTLLAFRLPTGDGIRVDAGYATGGVVTTHYDGLLAKLIAHGATREEALDRLAAALDEVVVLGLQTNLTLLQALVRNPDVRAGRLDTQLLERSYEPGTVDEEAALGAARALQARSAGRFRVGLAGIDTRRAAIAADGAVHVLVAGRDVRVEPDCAPDPVAAAHRHPGGGAIASAVLAPMPGRLLAVHVAEGDQVAAGVVLLVLEAMKMEHPVTAPFAGRVTRVSCAVGDSVAGATPLLELEA